MPTIKYPIALSNQMKYPHYKKNTSADKSMSRWYLGLSGTHTLWVSEMAYSQNVEWSEQQKELWGKITVGAEPHTLTATSTPVPPLHTELITRATPSVCTPGCENYALKDNALPKAASLFSSVLIWSFGFYNYIQKWCKLEIVLLNFSLWMMRAVRLGAWGGGWLIAP